jgi:hypothetical protein
VATVLVLFSVPLKDIVSGTVVEDTVTSLPFTVVLPLLTVLVTVALLPIWYSTFVKFPFESNVSSSVVRAGTVAFVGTSDQVPARTASGGGVGVPHPCSSAIMGTKINKPRLIETDFTAFIQLIPFSFC